MRADMADDTSAAAQGPQPISIPKGTLQRLDFATKQELERVQANIGYSARVWAQVSLPYRDPGDVPYWERQNGLVALTMRPALLTRPDGSRYGGYAYGLLPRHALTWISSEAVRTQDPVLKLGTSMNAFMAKIGLAKGGSDARRLTDQLERLFGSNLSIKGLMATENGRGEVTKYFQIADQVQLWFNRNSALDEENQGLWSSEVILSDQFFRSIVDNPVPVNLDAMRALGSSPMRLDIYLWATHRVYNMSSPTRIKWSDLNDQFGGQYAQARQFKDQFKKNLQAVLVIYPDLNVEITQDYLILKPSKPHVTPTKRRLELI